MMMVADAPDTAPGANARLHDPAHVRRALALGLSSFVARGRLRDAVLLWTREFEGRGSVHGNLNRYCRKLAVMFGLNGREGELHLHIFRALQLDTERLPPDVLSQPSLQTVQVQAAPAASSPEARLLQFFIEVLWRQVQLNHAGEAGAWRARVQQAVSSGLPIADRRPLLAWMSGAAPMLTGSWAAGRNGTALVNVFYVALAEVFGPAQADRLFSESVKIVEREAPRDLPPMREFL
jgi:hypothetical protein